MLRFIIRMALTLDLFRAAPFISTAVFDEALTFIWRTEW